MKKNFVTDFMRCGASGWCMECMWTGMDSIFFHKDRQLSCRTSVWMFPIYGMAACFSRNIPLVPSLKNGMPAPGITAGQNGITAV